MKATLVIAMLGMGTLCSAASFTSKADMQSTYQRVLNQVKAQGYSVERASPDAGIKTGITVTGHYHQTGSYLQIQFVQGANGTTVQVSVYESKRYKALQTEPWGTPKVNEEKSQAEAETLQKGLGH